MLEISISFVQYLEQLTNVWISKIDSCYKADEVTTLLWIRRAIIVSKMNPADKNDYIMKISHSIKMKEQEVHNHTESLKINK